MKPLLAALCLLSATAAWAGPPESSETYQVLYLAEPGVVVLQLTVLVEGEGPQRRLEKFIDALWKDLDSNRDGTVTIDEARGRILSAREAVQLQLVASDSNPVDASPDVSPKDGKISRAELVAYFKRIGLLPFVVRYQSRTADGDANQAEMANPGTDAPLFAQLDVNKDKKLSVEELANALEVLRQLDRDNDETISRAELQPLTTPARQNNRAMNNPQGAANPFVSLSSGESTPKLIRRIIDRYDSADPAKSGVPALTTKNQKLSRQELGATEAEFQKNDVDGDGQLDFAELRQYLSTAEPTLRLMLNVTEGKVEVLQGQTDQVRQSADGAIHLLVGTSQVSIAATPTAPANDVETMIRPLFTALDADANGYLEKSEAAENTAFGGSFADLDRDKNGKLFLEELVTFLKPRLEAAQNRVELSIVEQGRTLFDILDSNRDGRLAHREVRSISTKLSLWDTNGDGMLSESEIPLQYQMTATQGTLPNLGLFPAEGNRNRNSPDGRPTGPAWFRKMDRNSDGEISRREFLGELELFEELDSNHDGAIELNEALLARPAR